ncbi:hypothetical protein HZA55_02555 [Candidatus Poribacteria bacterium]|nr:hypothetical protein [Candidatus Poribacteria bacterium]
MLNTDDNLKERLNLYEKLYELTKENEFSKTMLYQREAILSKIKNLSKIDFREMDLSNEQNRLLDKIKSIIKHILELDNQNHTRVYQLMRDVEHEKISIEHKLRFLHTKPVYNTIETKINFSA